MVSVSGRVSFSDAFAGFFLVSHRVLFSDFIRPPHPRGGGAFSLFVFFFVFRLLHVEKPCFVVPSLDWSRGQKGTQNRMLSLTDLKHETRGIETDDVEEEKNKTLNLTFI